MTRDKVNEWVERYVAAWRSYAEDAIGDLFTEDASYFFQPWTEAVNGRKAIVENWMEEQDAPDSWSAEYETYATDGDKATVVGWTHYLGEDRRVIDKSYYNVWLLEFAADDRCKRFTEVYMLVPAEQAKEELASN
ncbi:MAG: nuclear transport factor 2 family protein [Chloroflexia bacterium]